MGFDIFSRDADCQLGGGGGSKENVSKVSARGGPKMGIFGVAADMWMTLILCILHFLKYQVGKKKGTKLGVQVSSIQTYQLESNSAYIYYCGFSNTVSNFNIENQTSFCKNQ